MSLIDDLCIIINFEKPRRKTLKENKAGGVEEDLGDYRSISFDNTFWYASRADHKSIQNTLKNLNPSIEGILRHFLKNQNNSFSKCDAKRDFPSLSK